MDPSRVAVQQQKALEKFVYEQYLTYYKNMDPTDVAQNIVKDESFTKVISSNIEHKEQAYCSNTKLSSGETWALMVTFRPDPGLEILHPELYKIALKLCKPLKGIREAIFCIEQSGTTEQDSGIGQHFHALIKLNKHDDPQNAERARHVRRIIQQLKKYQTKTTHFLDIKFVSARKISDKISYIKGDKYDEAKAQNMIITKQWREIVGLQPYYHTISKELKNEFKQLEKDED